MGSVIDLSHPTEFTMGVTPDGKVIVHFGKPITDLLLTEEEALTMCEGLVEAQQMLAAGRADKLRRRS